MQRRDFLKLLGMTATAVAATGLPVKEVAETIVAHEFPGVRLTEADIVALELERAYPAVVEAFQRDSAFFSALGFYKEGPDEEDVKLLEEDDGKV